MSDELKRAKEEYLEAAAAKNRQQAARADEETRDRTTFRALRDTVIRPALDAVAAGLDPVPAQVVSTDAQGAMADQVRLTLALDGVSTPSLVVSSGGGDMVRVQFKYERGNGETITDGPHSWTVDTTTREAIESYAKEFATSALKGAKGRAQRI